MENTLFIGDVPIETPFLSGFPIATFDDTGGYLIFCSIDRFAKRSKFKTSTTKMVLLIGYTLGVVKLPGEEG